MDKNEEIHPSKLCQTNHEAEIFAVCKTDNTYICEQCYKEKHRGHNVEYLKFIANDHLNSLKGLEDKISEELTICMDIQRQFSKSVVTKKIIDEINLYYEALILALRNSCAEKIKDVLDNQLEPTFTKIDKMNNILEAQREELSYLYSQTKQNVKLVENSTSVSKYRTFTNSIPKYTILNQKYNAVATTIESVNGILRETMPILSFKTDPKNTCEIIDSGITISNPIKAQPFSSPKFHEEKVPPLNTHEAIKEKSREENKITESDTIRLFQVLNDSPKPHFTENKITEQKEESLGNKLNVTYDAKLYTNQSNKLNESMSNNNSKHKLNKSIRSPIKKSAQKSSLPTSPEFTKKYNRSHTPDINKQKPKISPTPPPKKQIFSNKKSKPASSDNQYYLRCEKRIFYIEPLSKTLISYYPMTKETRSLKLICDKNLPEGFGAAEILQSKRIIISGGERNKIIISNVYEIYESVKSLVERKNMINPRRNHGFVCIQGYAVAAGGYNKSAMALKKCEKFDTNKNCWTELPELNEERNFLSICVVSDKYLYVFGGSNSFESKSESYELLNIENPDKWTKMTIISLSDQASKYKKSMIRLGFGLGSIQISKNEILLFGGLNEKEYFNSSYILNIESGILASTACPLKVKDAFYQRHAQIIGNMVYCYGYWSKCLHIFNIQNFDWNAINLS